MRATFIALSGSLITLASTGQLNKPPLEGNLDYLQKGLLDSLHPTNSWHLQWSPQWIPADCKSMTEYANLSAIDVDVFDVH